MHWPRPHVVPLLLALLALLGTSPAAAEPEAESVPWLDVAPHVRCLDLPGAKRNWIGADGPLGPLYVTRRGAAGTDLDRLDLAPEGARVTPLGPIASRTTLVGEQRPQPVKGGVLALVDDVTPPGVVISSNIVNRAGRTISRLALVDAGGARHILSAPGHDVSTFASDGSTAWYTAGKHLFAAPVGGGRVDALDPDRQVYEIRAVAGGALYAWADGATNTVRRRDARGRWRDTDGPPDPERDVLIDRHGAVSTSLARGPFAHMYAGAARGAGTWFVRTELGGHAVFELRGGRLAPRWRVDGGGVPAGFAPLGATRTALLLAHPTDRTAFVEALERDVCVVEAGSPPAFAPPVRDLPKRFVPSRDALVDAAVASGFAVTSFRVRDDAVLVYGLADAGPTTTRELGDAARSVRERVAIVMAEPRLGVELEFAVLDRFGADVFEPTAGHHVRRAGLAVGSVLVHRPEDVPLHVRGLVITPLGAGQVEDDHACAGEVLNNAGTPLALVVECRAFGSLGGTFFPWGAPLEYRAPIAPLPLGPGAVAAFRVLAPERPTGRLLQFHHAGEPILALDLDANAREQARFDAFGARTPGDRRSRGTR